MTNSKAHVAQEFLDEHATEIDRALSAFQESAAVFSSNKPRLIDEYENKWVAAHEGRIVAVADTMTSLLSMMSDKGVPANDALVRHIDREPKTLIL